MDDVEAIVRQNPQQPDAQEDIEGELVARRTHFVVAVPGRRHRADDAKAGHVFALIVGQNRDIVSQRLERARFLQDAHMTPVIAKERRGRDAQHAQAGSINRPGIGRAKR